MTQTNENTPDTEWEGRLTNSSRVVTDTTNTILALIPHIEGFRHDSINHRVDEIICNLLSSHTTYWKNHEHDMYESLEKANREQTILDIARVREERDTYWKERVEKDLDRRLEIQKKVLHSEYEGGYTQALKDVKEAHITNEDNLK